MIWRGRPANEPHAKLIQAKDPQEILAHQSEYVKQQLAAMEEHAKELGTAVLKAVTPDK